MKKILYLIIVALFAVTAGTAWGQTNRTLGDIPTGWKVQAGSVNFTADENNHEVQIPAGSTVTLTPLYPAKVKSVKLKDVPPTGAIKGEFTVNAGGKKVWFSQGNLQAVCSSADNDASTQETWTWRFAANQWEYIGSAAANNSINGNGSVSTAGTVDLFGWVGTSSSYDNYGIHNNTTASDYGNTSNESLKHDWGHNAIANGSNSADMWRTLTRDEWWYMLNTRSGATVNGTDNVRFAKATIRTDETAVKGVILFPDGATFEASEASWNDLNYGYNNYTTTCTAAQWTALEAKGCVFLPAASVRTGATVSNESSTGAYWTATGSNQSGYYTWAHMVYFNQNTWSTSSSYKEKSYGLSVRLVKDAQIVNLSTLMGNYEAQNGDILIGTLAGNYKISIADGATVTLRNATINGTNNNSYQWAGITCLGDATIVLEGTNTVTGFHHWYPGIQAAHNGTGSGDEYTLTIKGDGSLTASSNDYYGDFCAAGIGAGYNHACGNILIESGTIVANGDNFGAGIGGAAHTSCGTITITGGTVTATGGQYGAGVGSGIDGECQSISITGGTVIATGGSGEVSLGGGGAGIGSGTKGSCSTITITDGVTQVTATKGANAPYSIGAGGGSSASCGTVTIGGATGAITTSPYTYPVPITYPIALSAATSDYVGSVITTDGWVYATVADATAASKTAVAIIAYVGTAGSVDASSDSYKGLAIALSDANSGNDCQWAGSNANCLSSSQTSDITIALGFKNGISCTSTLTGDGHTHAAATAAAINNGTAAPTGASGWFMPSMGQWNLIVQGLATKKAGTPVTTDLTTSENNTYKANNLNSVITDAGGTGFQKSSYWASTEENNSSSWVMRFYYGYGTRYTKTTTLYVRSVIAF